MQPNNQNPFGQPPSGGPELPPVPNNQQPDPLDQTGPAPSLPNPGQIVVGSETAMPPQSGPTAPGQLPPVSNYASNTPLPLPPKKGGKFKKVALVLGAVLIVGGASAAAYVGVILPNKPENVLKQALVNSSQETQVSYKGTVEGNTSKDGDGLAYK